MAIPRLCSIPGCRKPHQARGWCNKHYQRWVAHGDASYPVNFAGRGNPNRFYQIAIGYEDDRCLIWPYGSTSNGRGIIAVGDGKSAIVSRRVCEAVHGPAPSPRHEAAHSCGDGRCVNPRHLRWATHVENMADQLMHGTRNRGERNGAAKLTREDIPKIREMLKTQNYGEVADAFGVNRGTIWQIDKGNAWWWA